MKNSKKRTAILVLVGSTLMLQSIGVEADSSISTEGNNLEVVQTSTIGTDSPLPIGSNVVILPGITIGDNSVIGAGSVVTHDIPENVIAVGNPCRVLRKINERDKEYYYKNRRVE
jgi:galactoside O-acetyltransferase